MYTFISTILIPFHIIHEYLYILYLQIFLSNISRRPNEWQEGNKGTVLLLQGLNEKWSFLINIGNFINSLGYTVLVIEELGENWKPLDQAAQTVIDFINKQEEPLIIVAHSKGGALGKIALQDHDASQKIVRLISIATPYHGTWWENIFPHINAHTRYNFTDQNCEKVCSIYPRIDNHVIPANSAHLNGAQNTQLDCVGHTLILKNKECMRVIEDYLDAARR